MAWLDDHPPSRSQFRDPRRAEPSGVVVVHTAENVMDTVGPDTGAEGVANFIRTRDTPGSYHDLVDSDSFLQMVRYTCEAFHDATGSNPHSYGLSFACRTTDWTTMGPDKRSRFIDNGAARAVVFAQWVKAQYGIDIPARRLSRAESENRLPGFISHGQRDPQRRTDPGTEFPWRVFLDRYAALLEPPKPPPASDLLEQPMTLVYVTGPNVYRLVTPWAIVALTTEEGFALDQSNPAMAAVKIPSALWTKITAAYEGPKP